MKKFLFLMLGLAVSASAVAGPTFMQKLQKGMPSATEAVRKSAPVSYISSKSVFAGESKMSTSKNHYGTPLMLAKAGKPEKPHTFMAAVTEQPEGTVKYYERTGGTALFLQYLTVANDGVEEDGYYYSAGDQSGLVTVVENGSTIWFKNLLYDPDKYWEDYWIQGTKTGSRVTINLGSQALETMGNYGDCYLVMGTVSYVNGTGFSFAKGSSTTARYNISNDVLSLQGTTVGTGTYAAYTGTGLSCYTPGYSETYCMGFCEWNTELTPSDVEIPEAPTMYTDTDIAAMEGNVVDYYRTGNSIVPGDTTLYLTEQDGYAQIFYAADGSTVYMRNPIYGFANGNWIKGTVSGNQLSFPAGQYIYWSNSSFLGLRTSWGTFTNGNGYADAPAAATYTIDGQTITLDNASEYTGMSAVLDSAYNDLGWYGCLDYKTVLYSIPATPTNLNVTPAATTADAAWTDNENSAWNLRYRPYDPAAEYYFNDFESEVDGWTGYDADGDGNWWALRSAQYSSNNTQCLTSASWSSSAGALTPDNWLVSPEVALNGVVRFQAWGQDPSYASEVFRVYVTTETGDSITTSDFVALSEDITAVAYDSINSGAGNVYIYDLSAYAGQRGHIAIRHYNITDMFCLNVDDFYVGNPDVTPANWTVVENVTSPYTITGLTPESMYEVQVQGANAGGVGDWTASTIFTTLADGLRGDVDDSKTVNIADVTALIDGLLSGNWDAANYDNADCNLDGGVNIADVTALIDFLLSGTWND